MSNPGSGRYTNYTPANTNISKDSVARYTKSYERFNKFSIAAGGDFFGNTPSSKDSEKKLVSDSVSALAVGMGDMSMFPAGVKLNFSNAVDLAATKTSRPGDPSNPYMPDISSPGASANGTVNLFPKATVVVISAIGASGYKPNYIIPNTLLTQNSVNLGTQSPSTTSSALGAMPVNVALVMGKSKATSGG